MITIPEIVVANTLSIALELCAIFTMWFGDWYDFYIVEKELEDSESSLEKPETRRLVDIV